MTATATTTSSAQIATAISLSKNLLAFYNANTGGARVNKFADRKTAERRCLALAQEIAEEGVPSEQLFLAIKDGLSVAQTQEELDHESQFIPAPGHAHDADDDGDLTKPNDIEGTCPWSFEAHGRYTCPHCGIHLENGVGEHMQEVNGTHIKHDKFQFACLGCGEEFGPAISKKATANKVGPRPAMAASMKLDRQILEVTTNTVYKNAFQVYKAGLVTSGQCDRLSGVLYTAAKQGNRLMSLNIGAYVFTLAVK